MQKRHPRNRRPFAPLTPDPRSGEQTGPTHLRSGAAPQAESRAPGVPSKSGPGVAGVSPAGGDDRPALTPSWPSEGRAGTHVVQRLPQGGC
jgi:hypothetical protein